MIGDESHMGMIDLRDQCRKAIPSCSCEYVLAWRDLRRRRDPASTLDPFCMMRLARRHPAPEFFGRSTRHSRFRLGAMPSRQSVEGAFHQ
jgi:hypothetical protein